MSRLHTTVKTGRRRKGWEIDRIRDDSEMERTFQ
jgi:hypothetical protein